MSGLEKFGQFIIQALRDKAIDQHLLMQQGHWKAPAVQELQRAVTALPPAQKELMLKVVVDVVDVALHDFLFALQDSHDRGLGIEVLAEGENVAEASGMLHGEHLGEDGWIAKYSRFPDLRKD